MMRSFSFDGITYDVPALAAAPISEHPLVSYVLTAFERSKQLPATLRSLKGQSYDNIEIIVVEAGNDVGLTRTICDDFGVAYARRLNTRDRRTAVTNNIGIQLAHGEIIIIQSAECKHASRDTTEQLIRPIIADPSVSTFPSVLDLSEDGLSMCWKFHPDTHPNCFITFCQAVSRANVMAIGGFDEEYVGWGFEDNDFNFRLQFSGVQCRHVPVIVEHQWHPSLAAAEPSQRAEYYAARIDAIRTGRQSMVANAGKDWGNPHN